MTNGPAIPLVPCCPGNGSGNLIPLLLVIVVLVTGHFVLKQFKKRAGKPEMKNLKNLATVAVVVVAAGVVFALKQHQSTPAESVPTAVAEVMPAPAEATRAAESAAAVPRLLELGADKCMACKMMAPIIDDLRSSYAGQLQVDFIDVWKNPEGAKPHDVRIIPMQIFFGADGREIFRHEGFYAKEDILAKWRELGVELK